MVGFDFNKAQLDNLLGNISLDMERSFYRVGQIIEWGSGKTDADLTAMGYTSSEIAQIRAFVTKRAQLRNIYLGSATLATAYNYRADGQPFWGIGIVG